MRMRTILSFFLLWAVATAQAQLTLDECRRLAQENYPLVRRYGLIEKAREYDLSNAGKGYLPQVSLSAKASYQSEATELPFEVPEIGFRGLPKDQYQVLIDVQQTLWDGGDIRARKRLTNAASDVETEQQNVDMYALNERVNQLFFSILLLDEQLKQNRLLQDDLERTYRQVSAYRDNGIANQSDLDAVSVEQLNTRQKRVELETLRGAYAAMLAAFIGQEVGTDTQLQKPQDDTLPIGVLTDSRPELRLFDAQTRRLDVQETTLKTSLMPRLGVFVQGGYGNPGLDMLKDDFSAYYVAGVRLSWNFGSLYTLKNDRRRIDNQRSQVATSRDVFLFNTRLDALRQDADVSSMRRQMQDDDEIIRLRRNIRRAAEAKVANGTMTVTDMLREITAENMALQTKALHEVQLLMHIWEKKHTLNN